MDNQTTLSFVPGSETSQAAAVRMDALGKAEADRERLFRAIHAAPAGMTDPEMQAALAMPGDTQRPRRNELAGNGRTSSAHPHWPVRIRRRKIGGTSQKPVWEKRGGAAIWFAVRGAQ